MKRLSPRNNRLKFKTAGKLPIVIEESIEYTQYSKGKTGGCEHVTGYYVTCQHWGSQPRIGENRQLVTDEPVEFEN